MKLILKLVLKLHPEPLMFIELRPLSPFSQSLSLKAPSSKPLLQSPFFKALSSKLSLSKLFAQSLFLLFKASPPKPSLQSSSSKPLLSKPSVQSAPFKAPSLKSFSSKPPPSKPPAQSSPSLPNAFPPKPPPQSLLFKAPSQVPSSKRFLQSLFFRSLSLKASPLSPKRYLQSLLLKALLQNPFFQSLLFKAPSSKLFDEFGNRKHRLQNSHALQSISE